jgi:acetoin utilization deacetylase AcuC-like enzyme
MEADTTQAGGGAPLPERDILDGFDRLIAAKRLFGAQPNPVVRKKIAKGPPRIVCKPPSRRRMLSLWHDLFSHRVSPEDFLRFLARDVLGVMHADGILLFEKNRLIYDCRVVRGEGKEDVGHLTIAFYRERKPSVSWLPYPTRPGRGVVFIEGIVFSVQNTGYATSLFRGYEHFFLDLGFHRFGVKAALSVGKYFWAKQGFDCVERIQFGRVREDLHAFVRSLDLPVEEQEIRRLNHMVDVAEFRQDIRVPVWRESEGYYAIRQDENYTEKFVYPLGKAFLLCGDPWDGYKIICADTPRRTGLVWSKSYLSHVTTAEHPEGPQRLTLLWNAILRQKLLSTLILMDPYVPPMEALHAVHDPAYLEAFREAVARGDRYFSTQDCLIGSGSYDAALLAAGGVMAGIDAVFNHRADNVFCAVRPPGHHAVRDGAMGFCFVNNVAVGAAYARSSYGIHRVCIVDWDVHHGNGTQDLFNNDPETLYASIHEHPSFCYPGTGRRMEKGKGAGEGYTLNVPLLPHAGDVEMIEAFEREIVPAIEAFRPELILVSAGFDAHRDDPIAELWCTEESYVHMTRRILELADRHCKGRVVSVLEGGYHPESLVSSAIAHIKALQGRPQWEA